MPQETLQWLADPANLNTDLLPPGLETYDPLPFLSSTGNVFMVTLLPQVRGLGAIVVGAAGGIGLARAADGLQGWRLVRLSRCVTAGALCSRRHIPFPLGS